jgi:hypothetical protein
VSKTKQEKKQKKKINLTENNLFGGQREGREIGLAEEEVTRTEEEERADVEGTATEENGIQNQQ